MYPYGMKSGSKKARGVSLTSNGPRLSKKKRKLLNENSDPDVLDLSSKYWHGLQIDASDDIKEKLLKHLSSPSRRYKLKTEGLVLPAKKKRKLQKNGSLETDSDDEKNSKKCKAKKKCEESPSSKLRKWKTELASLSGTKSKSKKSGELVGKGKKSGRQKLLSSNYEDHDGVGLHELGTSPELKNKARKKKLLSEKSKGANHLMKKKKVKVGKGVLTGPALGKKKKSKLRVNKANFMLLSKKQQNKMQKKFSLQLISDDDDDDDDDDDGGTDSDHTREKSISASSLKKNLAKLSKTNWMDINKKKLKKHLQELEIPKSKKSKQHRVYDDDDDDEEEEEEDNYEEEEEEDFSSVQDVSDDLEEEDDDDDDDESSEDRMSDDKSGFVLGLSKFWIKRHDDKAVVILKHPFHCQLLGTVKISVLSGSIKVLGARLSANGQWHNLYSPSSNMLLKLTTEHPTGNNVSEARATLSAMFSDTDCYSNLINPSVVVLLVCDMNWGFSDYISTVCPYQRLFQAPPREAHKFPCNKILKPFGISFFDTSELITSRTTPEIDKFFTKWPRILKDFDSPKILVCGNKNTGKSTFSQILLNMALESKKAVCFLDCDPGQTEFTPPGCISLSVIKQFVLGPPFCHQQDPAFNIFFGEVSPNKNCNHYLMCVWNALQFYWSLPERFPLIVNTMGWVTGMGKNLLDGILNMLGPNHVVLLNSLKNTCCPTDFSPDTVQQNPWNFPGDSEDNPTTSSCRWELTVLESVVSQDIISKSKLTPAELRNLSTLSYLGKTWSPGVSLNHNIPFKVKWTSLAIYVCQEFVPLNQILYAINASVVALCIADLNQAYHPNNDENFPMTFYKKPICKCVGFGFVRGIHAGSQMLYIVSPLPLSIISQVNTLLRGTIHLPLDKMQTQDVTDLKYVDKMLTKTMASQTNKKRRVLSKKKF